MTTQVVQAGSRVTVKAEDGTDGRDASREAFDAGLIANPTISAYTAYIASMISGTGTGSNALTLNGQPGSYYLNAGNLASGTVPVERLPAVSFASLTGKPTTIAGYGITDAVTTFAQLGSKPTTLAGYGITNAQPLDGDLTALAAATGTNTVYYRSGVDTWSPVSFGSGLTFSGGTLSAVTGGGGTVTSVAIATANGVSGTVTNPNTTPSIAITLGAITPTTVAASGNISGANLTAAGDTTGNASTATKLQTARNINGTPFDGTADITITANGPATHPGYVSGRAYPGPRALAPNTAGVTLNGGFAYAHPITIRAPVTATGIFVKMGSTDNQVRVSLYSSSAGSAGTLVADSAATTVLAGQEIAVNFASSVALQSGVYWATYRQSASATGPYTYAVADGSMMELLGGGGAPITVVTQGIITNASVGSAATASPATFPANARTANGMPMMSLVIA